MLARFHLKIGSLLGLLGILMATFAPVVSQTLASSRDGASLSASLCSAQSMPDDAPNDQDASHSLASHGQACGYCNLFAHMPAVPSVQPAFAITVWATQHRIATRFNSVRRFPPFTAAQPRAPPVSS
ncbi:hypothetical protein B0G69_5903 [Paraburkholderia sp. RAU2J]|uniref:DUF2946 domain-containing protein n=1 Tax=Paraburkholderia sp. RAU2J TaxID=1938810 RepID=UPI000EABE53E|nr:DUF2946 domain-containing protein [Paraburkholderia sp. RAU2J]RKT22442.1 hypothetical protein B0G69_5903 [Paraburkholderia sp. RAU2J]